MKKLKPVALVLLMCAILPACSTFHRPVVDAGATKVEQPRLVTDGDSELDIDAGFDDVDPFVVREASSTNGVLPHKTIKAVQVAESGVYDALQLIFAGTGYTVTVDGSQNAFDRYGSMAMFNLGGSLESVLRRMSDIFGFFYSVDGNVVTISNEQLFVVDLPPALMDDNIAGLVNTMQYLGAKDTYVDRPNRNVTFRANKKAVKSVGEYLDKIRTTRSLIVYEAHVYQVDLSDTSGVGIGWNKFTRTPDAAASARSSTFTGATTGSSLGAVIVGRYFSIDLLMDFLKSQGTVKTVSQPKIALLSNTSASFRVGETTTYLAKVSQTQTTGTATTTTATTETKDLQTGFAMALRGDYHDKTIYTKIEMTLNDLIKLSTVNVLGVQVSLPKTIDREIKTSVRARPGDMILLGGLTIARDQLDGSVGASYVGNSSSTARSELVVALLPRVVSFSGKRTTKPASGDVAVASPVASIPSISDAKE